MGRRERRKEKKKRFWTNIVLAVMFVFIVVGMTLGGLGGNFGSNSMKYGKYKFMQEGNHYITKIEGVPTAFYFHPNQVDKINVSSIIPNKLKEAYLVMLTFDPEEKNSIQAIELVRFDLSQLLGKVVYNGVLKESLDYDLPIITCANATLQTPVIIFNVSDTPSIVEQDNCIYLNAKGKNFLSLRDRLLYSYYGVIQDE